MIMHQSSHVDAVVRALENGIGILDCMPHQRGAQSEYVFGEALKMMIEDTSMGREDVAIITKVGPLLGETLSSFKGNVHIQPFPKGWGEEGVYQLNRESISHSLDCSCHRLQVKELDIALIQNPEILLKMGFSTDQVVDELERACGFLEEEVSSGRLKGYGISSNAFGESIPLPSLLPRLPTSNHFTAIQFPFNIFEQNAILPSPSGNLSTSAYAKEMGIARIGNRPLNARYQGTSIRIAPTIPSDGNIAKEIESAMNECIHLEKTFPTIEGDESLAASFNVAQRIAQFGARVSDLREWLELVETDIDPHMKERMTVAKNKKHYLGWLLAYRKATEKLLGTIRIGYEVKNQAAINQALSKMDIAEILPKDALHLGLHVDAVDYQLVGCRHIRQVDDLLGPAPTARLDALVAAIDRHQNKH